MSSTAELFLSGARLGLPGAAAGAVAGFALSLAVKAVNVMFGVQTTEPLTYMHKGMSLPFTGLETVDDLCIAEDLRALDTYRSYKQESFDQGCRFTQHLISANTEFARQRVMGRDGLKALARMQQASKRADRCFRALFFAVKAKSEGFGEEVEQSIGNLHVSFKRLVSCAQEEFSLRPQLSK